MLMRILATGLLAGALAGGIVASLQTVTTTPLILKAETYEKPEAPAEPAAAAPGHSHEAGTPAHSHGEGEEWAPEDGIERTAFTALATVSAGIGFAFMLLAVVLASGVTPTARTGLLWAAAAFAATGLAPALGLPPELPGAAAAELLHRQLWWIGTAIATALGIWLIARTGSPLAIAAGIALMVAPHVIGAPHPHELKSEVPAEIAGHFTAASLVLQAVLWALVGSIAGWLWQRSDSRAAAS